MEDIKKRALEAHSKYRGKYEICSKVPLKTEEDLSLFYTPGVAEPCKEIVKNPDLAFEYTSKNHVIAIVSDGSAVLGLGNIGGLAGLPVMEGKAVLFKKFANVDAVPICLETQDSEEIINIIKNITPSFGAIHLEDISAPRCFEIEQRLIEELDIPVFHDDQHGTAIVCLAGLINSLKITGKKMEEVKIVISGAGAAGIAITKLLLEYGFKNVILFDSKGSIYEGRENLNWAKEEIAKITNRDKLDGNLADGLKGVDIFIGVSLPNLVNSEMVKSMAKDSIIFAMANPDPEILPKEAAKGGAKIIATGRSDYPNQINNVLVFPGIFKGALKVRTRKITNKMKLSAAKALAEYVKDPNPDRIIPGVFEEGISDIIANAVINSSDE